MVLLIGCSFISCGSEPRNYTQEREEIRQGLLDKAQQITGVNQTDYTTTDYTTTDTLASQNFRFYVVYDSLVRDFLNRPEVHNPFEGWLIDHASYPDTIEDDSLARAYEAYEEYKYNLLSGHYDIQDSMPDVDAIKNHYEKLGGKIDITEEQHRVLVEGWDKNRKTVRDEWLYRDWGKKFYLYYNFRDFYGF